MKAILAAAGAAAIVLAAGSASAQAYPGPYGAAQPYPAQSYGAQPYNAQPYGAQPSGAQPYGAQPYGSGASVTFYEGENFSGRRITVYGEERDFARLGFNDRARSARTSGSFVVCENSEFRGRCERLSGAVRSLDQLGLNARISSTREDGPSGGYGGIDGGTPYDDRADDDRFDDDRPGRESYGSPRRDGVEGRTVVFFARPSVSGSDIAARGQSSADQFCRASGHGSAVYYTQGERSRRAVDQNGRPVDAPALRDVLCRIR